MDVSGWPGGPTLIGVTDDERRTGTEMMAYVVGCPGGSARALLISNTASVVSSRDFLVPCQIEVFACPV